MRQNSVKTIWKMEYPIEAIGDLDGSRQLNSNRSAKVLPFTPQAPPGDGADLGPHLARLDRTLDDWNSPLVSCAPVCVINAR